MHEALLCANICPSRSRRVLKNSLGTLQSPRFLNYQKRSFRPISKYCQHSLQNITVDTMTGPNVSRMDGAGGKRTKKYRNLIVVGNILNISYAQKKSFSFSCSLKTWTESKDTASPVDFFTFTSMVTAKIMNQH